MKFEPWYCPICKLKDKEENWQQVSIVRHMTDFTGSCYIGYFHKPCGIMRVVADSFDEGLKR